ncbi:hypothetical protein A1D25_02970 [Ursidibacter arcticus]|nr:hypothetical protein A1D25_02970 [Ursidibacter arcticus]
MKKSLIIQAPIFFSITFLIAYLFESNERSIVNIMVGCFVGTIIYIIVVYFLLKWFNNIVIFE